LLAGVAEEWWEIGGGTRTEAQAQVAAT
jgi:hypothetical protein